MGGERGRGLSLPRGWVRRGQRGAEGADRELVLVAEWRWALEGPGGAGGEGRTCMEGAWGASRPNTCTQLLCQVPSPPLPPAGRSSGWVVVLKKSKEG